MLLCRVRLGLGYADARSIREETVAKEGFLMLWAQRARILGWRQGTALSITRELSALTPHLCFYSQYDQQAEERRQW